MSYLGYDTTIDRLDEIVRLSSAADDRAGYFAAMYLAVTRTVRQRAVEGRFEAPGRMERFVSSFAARYLAAYAAWRGDLSADDPSASAGPPLTAAWQVAFDATGRWRPVILQHLLLGMNAHINLDLGVTAAGLAEDGDLEPVRADFDAINGVLAELVEGCQRALGGVSPWIGLADRIGGRHDTTLIRFSLVAARRQAWNVAEQLSPLAGDDLAVAVADVDAVAASVGDHVAHPGLWASALLLPVRLRERARAAKVIELLVRVQPGDG